jgi:hypothetical protein
LYFVPCGYAYDTLCSSFVTIDSTLAEELSATETGYLPGQFAYFHRLLLVAKRTNPIHVCSEQKVSTIAESHHSATSSSLHQELVFSLSTKGVLRLPWPRSQFADLLVLVQEPGLNLVDAPLQVQPQKHVFTLESFFGIHPIFAK